MCALLATAFAVLATACTASPPSSDSVVAVLERLMKADNAGDLDAIANAYAVDAVLMPPTGAIVRGRDAIRGRYAAGFERFRLEVRLIADETRAAGDWAFSRGRTEGRFVWLDGRTPSPFRDRYLMILKRAPEGEWKVAALMWSSELEEQE